MANTSARTSQSLQRLSPLTLTGPAGRPFTAPLKRGQLAVPTIGGRFEPLNDLSRVRVLNYLGLVIGVAGILTVIPPLGELGAIFGLGFIVWFAWAGIVMVRSSPGVVA